MTTPASSLLINGLELCVYLGWPDQEQHEAQVVHLDVDIWFPKPPLACDTDKLEDTICYATLVDSIQNFLGKKKFRLIEHLCKEIHTFIKAALPDGARVIVKITKHPRIQGLTGGVRFSYWDDMKEG